MKWSEKQIGYALARFYFNNKHIMVVNNSYWTGYECDLLCITKSLRPIDFEIKISRSDFFADSKKDKWKSALKTWKHYFIMPDEIYSHDLLARLQNKKSGVITLIEKDGFIYLSEKKKAQSNNNAKITGSQLVDIARMVSMRLWKD